MRALLELHNEVLLSFRGGEFTSAARAQDQERRNRIAARGSAPNTKNQVQTFESNLSMLKNMIEQPIPQQEITFPDNSIMINNRIARKVISIYESLNKNNKKNMENMLNESISSFRKVINFAIKAQNGK